MTPPDRVVFDCNVYFQALIGPNGPAGRCLEAAFRGEFILNTSNESLGELRDVCLRPHLAKRFGITSEKIDSFIEAISSVAVVVNRVPHVFEYERDPKDAHYIDLAVATNSKLIVSRDNDLLALMDISRPESAVFAERFPGFRVVTPVGLLEELEQQTD